MKFPRSFYIPKGAVKVASKKSSAVVYLSASSSRLCAVGFFGKADKPSFSYSFKSAERRVAYVAEWLQNMDRLEERRNKAKADRKQVLGSQQTSLKVRDVLRCSWGYDQTNIDYYQVVSLFGKRGVVVRQIACESVDTEFMQGMCVPAIDQFIGEPMRKQVSDSASVKIHSFASAYKMEPIMVAGVPVGYSPSSWTAYA